MIFLNILIILFALGFLGYGIFLLYGNRWLPKLHAFISYKSDKITTVSKIEVWWFRAGGIFYIIISIFLLLGILLTDVDLTVLLIVAVVALLARFVLGMIFAHRRTKKENTDQEML